MRIEVQGTPARHFLLPHLSEFLASHPGISLSMSKSDRWVDLVKEGVDCVLRYGRLRDKELIARHVTTLKRLTCASPGYLERYGVPASIDNLANYRMAGLLSLTSGQVTLLEFH